MRRANSILVLIGLLMFETAAGTRVLQQAGKEIAQASSNPLPIAPLQQQTNEWCWAASASMVLQYLNMPALNADYQCGIVAYTFSQIPACLVNCFNCPVAAGQFDNIARVIGQYGAFARTIGIRSPNVHGRWDNRALTWAELTDSIDKGSPILAGISANGFSNPMLEPQHAVVIVGYDATSGVDLIYVNDPWMNYWNSGGDPYLARGATVVSPGQYELAYATFVTMLWNRSIHHM